MSNSTTIRFSFPHHIRRILLSISILLLFGISACATGSEKAYTKDGKAYGHVRGTFRHRWWNYYERGLSFAEGKYYGEAVSDLREAIRQRSEDQRMARTYGMHFIDYFPHRELGIILYETQDLDTAKQELELSLGHFPSAKAHFYLDRIRKIMIEQTGKEIPFPALGLDLEKKEIWSRDDPIQLSGEASDENYISEITIMGTPFYIGESSRHVPFKKSLSLPQGKHIVEVTAKNLSGKVSTLVRTIHIDREGPIISIEQLAFEDTSDSKIFISGVIFDEAGVTELRINKKTIPADGKEEFLFSQELVSDGEDLELKAVDRLGNETTARISLQSVLDESNNKGTGYRQNTESILLASTDLKGLRLAAIFGPNDNQPPIISIKGWTDRQAVFLDRLYLEGNVRDDSKIVRLSINQAPILRREGKRIFFTHVVDLQEGENQFVIEADDEEGNTATRKIIVIRKIPKALQLEERLSITVLPFEQRNQVSKASFLFQDNLIDALVNQNRFRIIERDKLDVILQEQKLSRTKLIDRKTALKLGRLIAAQSVLTGSIIQTRNGIEIVVRLVDTETSEIIATEDVYDEIYDLLALRSLSEGMAIKLHQQFPLLDGLIIQKKGNYIFSDLGMDKIKIRRRLIIYREEPIKHPVTGKILGSDNIILGRAHVTQVMPDLSKAEILKGEVAGIRPMDKVITE